MFMLFLIGSLVFGICWAILEHDLQGAFGVSAYIISFVGLLVGTVQTSMGRVSQVVLIRPLL